MNNMKSDEISKKMDNLQQMIALISKSVVTKKPVDKKEEQIAASSAKDDTSAKPNDDAGS